MNDLNSKTDVEFVVREHYRRLLEDAYTAPVFSHLDLEDHFPRIFTFWCFVLNIDAEGNPYRGSAFEPHTRLGLTAEHFTLWLKFLHETIKNHFEGPIADKWIAKSNELGMMFQYKMGLLNDNDLAANNSEKPVS
jgi:hemoglobin